MPSDPVIGRESATAQTENNVRHAKYVRIKGIVVKEGCCSTVLQSTVSSFLNFHYWFLKM